MAMEGMDIAGVRALAGKFGAASATFTTVASRVEAGLRSSPWEGGDAARFRADWSSRHRPALIAAAEKLQEMRKLLLQQADEQERASDGARGVASMPALHGLARQLREHLDKMLADVGPKVSKLLGDLGETLKGAGEQALRWLDWVTGPDGPKLEDLTARVPGLQKLIGDISDIAMQLPGVREGIGWALGFEYVPEGDYYTTNEHSLQSMLGFHDLYDRAGPALGMDLDEKVVQFEFDGKEYRFEVWKGGYGAGGAYGGEIGLYTRNGDGGGPLRNLLELIPGFYSTAAGEDQIRMTQTIYNKNTGELLFTNDNKGSKDGDHFWNLAIRTDPGIRREDLGQIGTLYVKDAALASAMERAMRDAGMNVSRGPNDEIIYKWE